MSTGRAKKPVSTKKAALLDQLKRRRGVRELAKRFLIVCEDDKSAPDYFDALKKHFRLSAASVMVVGSGGDSQPIQVVQQAIGRKDQAARSDSGTEQFDQVWCIIDGDYGDKIANARGRATANGIELAISTQWFEYWLLLHFEESAAPTQDCDGVVRLLKKRHLPGYQKGTCDFDAIIINVRDACSRAERLRKPGIDRGELPEQQNPCSEVYKLVNALLDASS